MPVINKQPGAVLMVVLLFIASSKGHGQWTNNPTINTPVCTTLGSQQFLPQIAADGSGGAIIVWMEATVDFSSSRIYAQHLSSAGTRLWAAGGIDVSSGSGLFSNPQIVSDGNGGAIISWVKNTGTTYQHYMQKLSAAGQLQWTPGGILVCAVTQTIILYHQLISDGHGGAILLWDDQRATQNQVFAQRLDANGNLKWPVNGVSVAPLFTEISGYDAVADSAGGVLLCYFMRTNPLYGMEPFAQHVDENGTILWGATGKNLAGASGDQMFCKITKDTNDHTIIVWQDFRLDPVWSQLYAQRLDPAGNELWQPNGILLADSVSPVETVIKIVSDTKRGAMVSWLDQFTSGQPGTAHLMGIRVDSLGHFVWNKKEMAGWQATQLPMNYHFGADYKGGGFIVWSSIQSYGQGAYDNYDIAAQHVQGDGTLEYALGGTPVSSVPMDQFYQQLITDSTGVAIVAWSDLRNMTDYDLYAARIAAPVLVPVNWISFTGALSEKSVQLTWQTADEMNNKGFIIQRSHNGLQFDSLGFVAAADIGQLNTSYHYTDPRPGAGINFYRLAQCDLDGTISFSRTIRIDVIERPHRLRIYPNPASQYVLVDGLTANNIIMIYHADGRKIKEVRPTGTQFTQIDLSEMQPGVYYLGLMGDHRCWMPFIKR